MKSASQAMDYEHIPFKLTKGGIRKMAQLEKELNINKMSTFPILWHVVKRHKFGLVVSWGVGYPLFQMLHFFNVV